MYKNKTENDKFAGPLAQGMSDHRQLFPPPSSLLHIFFPTSHLLPYFPSSLFPTSHHLEVGNSKLVPYFPSPGSWRLVLLL